MSVHSLSQLKFTGATKRPAHQMSEEFPPESSTTASKRPRITLSPEDGQPAQDLFELQESNKPEQSKKQGKQRADETPETPLPQAQPIHQAKDKQPVAGEDPKPGKRKAPMIATIAGGFLTAVAGGVPLIVKTVRNDHLSQGANSGLSTVTGIGVFALLYGTYQLSKDSVASAVKAAARLPKKLMQKKPAETTAAQ